MKRNFIKVLPLAAAVLLATSCSKDENNDNEVINNEVINNEQQEIVVNKPQTITVSGTIENKAGLSKSSLMTDESGSYIDYVGDEIWITMKNTTAIIGSTITLTGSAKIQEDKENDEKFTFEVQLGVEGVTIDKLVNMEKVSYAAEFNIMDAKSRLPVLTKKDVTLYDIEVTKDNVEEGAEQTYSASNIDAGDLSTDYKDLGNYAYILNGTGTTFTVTLNETETDITVDDGEWIAVPLNRDDFSITYNGEVKKLHNASLLAGHYYKVTSKNWNKQFIDYYSSEPPVSDVP